MPQHGARHVRELHEQAVALLAIADAALPPAHPVRDSLHDMAAEAMLEGHRAYCAKTNDWTGSQVLLRMARNIVVGTTLASRIDEDLEALARNAESGNDWCSRDYWELPADVIAQLEEIRAKTRAGDLEGALRDLSRIDPRFVGPLRRCYAFCLSHRAMQIYGEALAAADKPTAMIQKFLGVIDRKGTVPVPNPRAPAWLQPECPCCGRNGYTQWYQGKFGEQQFWMCERCSAADDAERTQRRNTLHNGLRSACEYFLFAGELDRDDPGVRQGVEFAEKITNQLEIPRPSTSQLRGRLLSDATWFANHRELTPTQAGERCFFCGKGQAAAFGQIRVPMCGDVREVEILSGTGREFTCGDVIVPRCTKCREIHREFPGKLAAWRSGRAAATAEARFPVACETLRRTKAARDNTAVDWELLEDALSDAKAAIAETRTLRARCATCRADLPHDNLCRKCDRRLFEWGAAVSVSVFMWIAAAIGGGYLIIAEFGKTPAVVTAIIPLVVACLLGNGRERALARERTRVTGERATQFEQTRRSATEKATRRAAEVQFARDVAKDAADRAREAHEEAERELRAAREAVDAEYVSTFPEPSLPPGVRPESAYLESPSIAELVARGYGFGKTVALDSGNPGREPVDVSGLVSSGAQPERQPGTGRKPKRRSSR